MAIRLANSCNNCQNLSGSSPCNVHGVKVSQSYTCDSFEMKEDLRDERDCLTCTRYETENCTNPQKASEGMLCLDWAPKNAA